MHHSLVALARSDDHYPGVQTSLRLLKEQLITALMEVETLVVKINMVITKTPRYPMGVELATTPVTAVHSFIDFILPFYRGKIILAEEAAWGDTKEGFTYYGFAKLADEYQQVELLDLREDEEESREITYPGGTLELPLSKTLIEAPFLVSITRPKTHCSVVMTGGLKNVLVGAIKKYANRRKIHQERAIHYLLDSLAAHVYPQLVILDGTIGMEGGGPVRGTAIHSGWVLSSFDGLAADSLAVSLMGLQIEDIGYFHLLKQQGLGKLFPIDPVEIKGAALPECETPYRPHRNTPKIRAWKMDHRGGRTA
jgi:uncharacterized protein (DUF362 family)